MITISSIRKRRTALQHCYAFALCIVLDRDLSDQRLHFHNILRCVLQLPPTVAEIFASSFSFFSVSSTAFPFEILAEKNSSNFAGVVKFSSLLPSENLSAFAFFVLLQTLVASQEGSSVGKVTKPSCNFSQLSSDEVRVKIS